MDMSSQAKGLQQTETPRFMKLFEPLTTREMTLKNRIIMAPMGTNLSLARGTAGAFYKERAKGGVGAIIVGGMLVDQLNRGDFAKKLHGWIAAPVQEYDTKMGLQLFYPNMYPCDYKGGSSRQLVAPSAGVPYGATAVLPFYGYNHFYCRELTLFEIDDIVERYALAAERVKEAGFDFIEMHGCHGHNLAHQFFSPLDNRRTDKYGGDLTNRMRFAVEATRAIRETIGKDYPFFWRLCAEEGLPGGYTFNECVELCMALEKNGVDVIDVSFGHEVNYDPAPLGHFLPVPCEERPVATFVPYAEAIKKKVNTPVVGVGRIHTPELAEELLIKGKVDLVAIGRQLLADPSWPRKVAMGELEDIRPCICCNHCLDEYEKGNPIRCTVNAFMGREDEWTIPPSKQKKRVLVVGGGPAGMEAARVAAIAGHDVTLYEKETALGGQLLLASKPPRKEMIKEFVGFLIKQVQKLGVAIQTGEEVNLKVVSELKPDAVILATGVTPVMPAIKGITRENVVRGEEVMAGNASVGNRVAIIGGGEVGCELAELLAEKGKKVIVVEVLDELASKLPFRQRHFLSYQLASSGIQMLTKTKCEEITDKGLQIINMWGGKESIELDTIVIATGATPDNSLAEALKGKLKKLYTIGDCVEPRRIVNAIEEGARIALGI